MGSFVRRVTTASGATAVQIVHKRGHTVVGIDHIGPAHDEQRLALLLEAAKQRLRGDQQMLELSMPAPALVEPSDPPVPAAAAPVVEATGSLILWEALAGIYASLGFGEIGDEAFRALVLGRIIEPTSKVDAVRVLDEPLPVLPRVGLHRCPGVVPPCIRAQLGDGGGRPDGLHPVTEEHRVPRAV